MKRIYKRLTYANVMSTLAVFLVLGGATAFAATHLGKNSVGAKQLKASSVTSAKIKNGAVTAAKIKNGAIDGSKVDLASLGAVPNSEHAADAATVGGMTVSRISYTGEGEGAQKTVLNSEGLVLTAHCLANQPVVIATVPGVPNDVGVEFNAAVIGPSNEVITVSDDGSGPIFSSGDKLLEGRKRGTFTFQRSDGHVVSGIFGADASADLHDRDGGNSPGKCAFAATIFSG